MNVHYGVELEILKKDYQLYYIEKTHILAFVSYTGDVYMACQKTCLFFMAVNASVGNISKAEATETYKHKLQ